ncbi:hypothetical protein AV530_019595 [Patagioenas fasciata monilis]|uniref:Uncharacterized protein n=1 Tax=Patagioenas fasciata monilis TaxID=372326 RepID=A0A1V4JE94_PATFA|nr:hypothetical protein AV530_019595 [Patagioenas fasciata monilis]
MKVGGKSLIFGIKGEPTREGGWRQRGHPRFSTLDLLARGKRPHQDRRCRDEPTGRPRGSRHDWEFTEWDALGRAGTSSPEQGEIPRSGEGTFQVWELLLAVGYHLSGLAHPPSPGLPRANSQAVLTEEDG